jgi:hypothetical protein
MKCSIFATLPAKGILQNTNMEYREIVAVTGLPGLYQLLTTKSDGAIVRSVADKSTKFISARQHNVTPLESIEVYTTGDNVRLHEVFRKMQDSEGKVTAADPKSADDKSIKSYFKNIFPEFDDERVYVSDMKKMLKWYDLLKANDLLKFEDEQAEEEKTEEQTAAEEAPKKKKATAAAEDAETEEKPKKAASKKKAEVTEPAAEGEEKPKKAATKKKAAEPAADGEEKPAKKTAKKKKTEE